MARRKAFLLRVSEDVYDAIHGWAEQELRSVNAQIEFILREAVKRRTGRDVERKPKTSTQGRRAE